MGSLLAHGGRLLIADFDTYSEKGHTLKDFLISTWYNQDGVRIDAETRTVIKEVYASPKFKVTFARFQRKLCGINIPHFVASCQNLEQVHPIALETENSYEEKKYD